MHTIPFLAIFFHTLICSKHVLSNIIEVSSYRILVRIVIHKFFGMSKTQLLSDLVMLLKLESQSQAIHLRGKLRRVSKQTVSRTVNLPQHPTPHPQEHRCRGPCIPWGPLFH